jgi:hypothetical protein
VTSFVIPSTRIATFSWIGLVFPQQRGAIELARHMIRNRAWNVVGARYRFRASLSPA